MKTCLIVDDSPFDRLLLKHCAENLGLEGMEAATPQDAISACASKLPDCVLLDWEMPEMSGIEVLRKIRTMPHGDKVFIILCTANDTVLHARIARNEGADSFIAKPVTISSLQSVLQRLSLIPSEGRAESSF